MISKTSFFRARYGSDNAFNIAGEFIDGRTLIGKTSNAQYTLTSFDPLENPSHLESYDNFYLANTANSIIDFSETNPFGSI